jgi:hypothetical protein
MSTTSTVEKKYRYINALACARTGALYVAFDLERYTNDSRYQGLSRSEACSRRSSWAESRGKTPQNRRTASPMRGGQPRAAGSRPRSLSGGNDLGRAVADRLPRKNGFGGGRQLLDLALNQAKPAETAGCSAVHRGFTHKSTRDCPECDPESGEECWRTTMSVSCCWCLLKRSGNWPQGGRDRCRTRCRSGLPCWRLGSGRAGGRPNRASPNRTSLSPASSTLTGRFAGSKSASDKTSQTLIGRSGAIGADLEALMCFNASNPKPGRPPGRPVRRPLSPAHHHTRIAGIFGPCWWEN